MERKKFKIMEAGNEVDDRALGHAKHLAPEAWKHGTLGSTVSCSIKKLCPQDHCPYRGISKQLGAFSVVDMLCISVIDSVMLQYALSPRCDLVRESSSYAARERIGVDGHQVLPQLCSGACENVFDRDMLFLQAFSTHEEDKARLLFRRA